GTRRPVCRASRHGLPVSYPTHDSARRVDPAEMTRKLRPYDQPPRRKRTLIPSAPDSAAGLFLVVAILWLLAAAGLGILAAGARQAGQPGTRRLEPRVGGRDRPPVRQGRLRPWEPGRVPAAGEGPRATRVADGQWRVLEDTAAHPGAPVHQPPLFRDRPAGAARPFRAIGDSRGHQPGVHERPA